jgi:hypothetical protein
LTCTMCVLFMQRRQPFNIVGWLKTPYGIIAGVMLFSVVVMPRLKVDPEEYQQMLEEKDRFVEAAKPDRLVPKKRT